MKIKQFLQPNKVKIFTFIFLIIIGFVIGGARNFGADWFILKIWYIFGLPAYFFGLLFPESNTLLFFPIFIVWIYILACATAWILEIKNKKKL